MTDRRPFRRSPTACARPRAGMKLDGLRILLENTSGQGSSVGSRFEEMRAILDLSGDLPMGVCVDTAHIFAAGHDIRTAEGLERRCRCGDDDRACERVT